MTVIAYTLFFIYFCLQASNLWSGDRDRYSSVIVKNNEVGTTIQIKQLQMAIGIFISTLNPKFDKVLKDLDELKKYIKI